MIPLRIAPVPGYTPTVGRLVSILAYVRHGLLAAVEGLSRDQLDHLHDAESNSIGALLAHMAAVERWYQVFTFEGREPSAGEEAEISAALHLGDEARRTIRGRELDAYLEELARTRKATLEELRARDDAWLEAPLAARPDLNAHWAWVHVAEDEIGHRGQIRWLRKRLPI
ncbi:MAG TPA: DinB family protein [Thermoanaerobaculaceae bacterium]|nr:DinB family protein [Thermoanaerobaculaceae bacterium]